MPYRSSVDNLSDRMFASILRTAFSTLPFDWDEPTGGDSRRVGAERAETIAFKMACMAGSLSAFKTTELFLKPIQK